MFFGPIEKKKQDGYSCLWLAGTFSTSPLKPQNGIQWNLIGNKTSMFSTMFVFFGPIEKMIWPPWPLIGWHVFVFSFETAERISSKLNRKQDLNVLFQVCIFWPIRKTRWPPWTLICWDIFDFYSETAEPNSAKLDRKQDLNGICQVCFWPSIKQKSVKKVTLTPPDTWPCPTLGLASVLMLRPISPELVLFPDFWISNIPRYFCFYIVLRCTICCPLDPLF